MKRTATTCATIMFALAAIAADVDHVFVRQQWPWSANVTVEYRLSNVGATPVSLLIEAFDGETPLDSQRLAAACTGDVYGITENGIHKFSFDPAEAFGSSQVAYNDFKIRLSVSETPNMNDVLYRIVDLQNGGFENVTRADFYNNKGYGAFVTNYADIGAGYTTDLEDVFIWTGVTNNPEYKTTKLVLRRIPATNVSWTYAAFPAENPVTVKLTNDFWVAVFDFTYEQWKTVMGSYKGSFTDAEAYPDFATYPVSGVRWDLCVGYDYYSTPVDSDTPQPNTAFMFAKLMTFDTNLVFNFPTEAQWEWASYGGATNSYYHGAASVNEVAWSKSNSDGHPHPVGQKRPNAFGLYDVIGNVQKFCRDWYVTKEALVNSAAMQGDPLVDPVGPSKAESAANVGTGFGWKVLRGGSYGLSDAYSKTTNRNGLRGNVADPNPGIRIWARDK